MPGRYDCKRSKLFMSAVVKAWRRHGPESGHNAIPIYRTYCSSHIPRLSLLLILYILNMLYIR